MEAFINQSVTEEEIARLQRALQDAEAAGDQQMETQARFSYAHALLRSDDQHRLEKGVKVLENLYYSDTNNRRDYLYYIAIGQTKLKQYNQALDCVEQFLAFEPENRQAKQLRAHIKDKLTKEGLLGMAITGAAVLAVGGIIGLMKLAKK